MIQYELMKATIMFHYKITRTKPHRVKVKPFSKIVSHTFNIDLT